MTPRPSLLVLPVSPVPAPGRHGLAALALAALLAAAAPATAAPGSTPAAAPASSATAPLVPRFTASSDLFELVGVLEGDRLTLFLDDAATNAPVAGARLELEIAGRKLALQPVAAGAPATAGDFTVTLAPPLPEGTHPVTATVTTPKDADLLAGELVVRAGEAAGPADPGGGLGELWAHRRTWVVGGAVALAAAAVGAVALARRRGAALHDGRPA